MATLHSNGGLIGKTIDFADTTQNIIGETPGRMVASSSVGGSMTPIWNYYQDPNTIAINSAVLASGIPDDILLMVIAFGNATIDGLTISNFTQLAKYSMASGSSGPGIYIGYQVLQESALLDPLNQYFTMSNLYDVGPSFISYTIYRNVDISNPLDVSAIINSASNTLSPPSNINTITPMTPGSVVLNIGMSAYNVDTTYPNNIWGYRRYTTTSGIYPYVMSGSFLDMGSRNEVAAGVQTYAYDWQSGSVTTTSTWSLDDPSMYGGTANGAKSISVKIALRPKIGIKYTYGSNKNSGIWALDSVYEYKNRGFV